MAIGWLQTSGMRQAWSQRAASACMHACSSSGAVVLKHAETVLPGGDVALSGPVSAAGAAEEVQHCCYREWYAATQYGPPKLYT